MIKYDLAYYENMLRIYSKTAETINKIRWDWVSEIEPKTVLDYGSGIGWFKAYAPVGIDVYTYDIMPVIQTGITLRMYDLCCFWDVLEHVPDFAEIEPILALSNHVAVTLPIWHNKGDVTKWKHFKPGEHLHFMTEEIIEALFNKYGFDLLKKGQPENALRVDITSFLFKKRKV